MGNYCREVPDRETYTPKYLANMEEKVTYTISTLMFRCRTDLCTFIASFDYAIHIEGYVTDTYARESRRTNVYKIPRNLESGSLRTGARNRYGSNAEPNIAATILILPILLQVIRFLNHRQAIVLW